MRKFHVFEPQTFTAAKAKGQLGVFGAEMEADDASSAARVYALELVKSSSWDGVGTRRFYVWGGGQITAVNVGLSSSVGSGI
jgi:hypothetical protein